jgi:BirA family biotin operon repressor/biotin-[acetyl-CoA-carboxylase] ligase
MIGSTIEHLDRVDSTNNYAAHVLLTKSLNDGAVFVAGCQHSGRGQANAVWESESDKNLTFSIVLFPAGVKMADQFMISKAISLGIADFLQMHLEDVTIKWPNDIYVGDRKIAGILIETAVSSGLVARAIIGIGLNVNQIVFKSDAPNPVSMKNITAKEYQLSSLLQELCRQLDQRYLQLMDGKYDRLNEDYLGILYRFRQWALFRDKDQIWEGRIVGTDHFGSLMIEDRNGKVSYFQFKEVSFLQE